MNSYNSQHTSGKGHSKGSKKDNRNELFETFYLTPQSRRMAVTEIGYPDQTYLITQTVFDWIQEGKAQVIGKIKCTRSGYWVQSVTTNPDLFVNPFANQLNMFDNEY